MNDNFIKEMKKDNCIEQVESKNILKKISLFFKDGVFVYSFFASIIYSILFYVIATPNMMSKIYKYSTFLSDTFNILLMYIFLLDILIIVFFWILYRVFYSPNSEIINKKRNKYSLGYGLFLLPLTAVAFYERGGLSITLNDVFQYSIMFSLYRIIGSILLLMIINLFIELLFILYKKIFNVK